MNGRNGSDPARPVAGRQPKTDFSPSGPRACQMVCRVKNDSELVLTWEIGARQRAPFFARKAKGVEYTLVSK
ncbi:hypothetical protein KUW09_12385 [Mameliella alba]|nr:hypothetical protein [Mameliella alba]